MKKTVTQYAEQLIPYINSLHRNSVNFKFKVGDLSSYPDMDVFKKFCNELKKLSVDELTVLRESAKQAKATCPYPYTREAYAEIIKQCNYEARMRQKAEATIER